MPDNKWYQSARFWINFAITVVLLVGLISFAVYVFSSLGTAPTLASDGKTVLVDRYGRAKDILTLIIPVFTIAAGYWFGSQGTAKAQDEAKTATKAAHAVAAAATAAATDTQSQTPLDSVADAVHQVRAQYPTIF